MRTLKNVYLSGLGAVGATYASLFYDKGKHSIKVIVDEERFSRYQRDCIHLNGKRYDFDYVLPQQASEPADLIIIAVKGGQLQESIDNIRPFVGRDTILMSLLNGISSEDVLEQAFGQEKILHAFCVATDAVREGTRIQFSKYGQIVFGDHYDRHSEKVEAVKALFDSNNVPYRVPNDIRREQWWKFMMNVGINQLSAILRASYGVFTDIEEAQKLLFMACREVLPIASREGITLTEEDIAGFIPIFKQLAPDSKTSMLQDVEAGRKTEVESFALAVIALGKKHGIPTPVNDVLYYMIRTIEKTYPKETSVSEAGNSKL
jgi:2-dehydropantoate 2-reductase